ncbi:MAG: hypothetical protein KQH83_08275 [Actinobacteria bacterium]|nr:hypothetical protein [Actinomycetota bacterium]
MRDVAHQLRDYWSDLAAGLPAPSLEGARFERPGAVVVRPLEEAAPGRRPAWAAAMAAFAGVSLLGGALWLWAAGGDRGTVSAIPAPADWDPVLATTVAGTPPAAAECPAGSDPDAAGPADQDRPPSGARSNQTAAFDLHAGRIVYVIAEMDGAWEQVPAQTWTFDVCANTWQRMDPGGDPSLPGNLVYDVDSDRTISFATGTVGVYDATTDTWTRRDRPAGFRGDGGAVYDPVSGLVVVQLYRDDAVAIAAYDVDSDRWTLVGSQSRPTGASLVGYAAGIDRLVLQGYDVSQRDTSRFPGPTGGLLDPRTGEVTLLPEPGPRIVGGFGAYVYATGTDTAVILTEGAGVCRFGRTTLRWDHCVQPVEGFAAYDAMVFDPIAHRLVLIHGLSGAWWTSTTDGVWAIDLDDGGWHRLVPAVTPAVDPAG